MFCTSSYFVFLYILVMGIPFFLVSQIIWLSSPRRVGSFGSFYHLDLLEFSFHLRLLICMCTQQLADRSWLSSLKSRPFEPACLQPTHHFWEETTLNYYMKHVDHAYIRLDICSHAPTAATLRHGNNRILSVEHI